MGDTSSDPQLDLMQELQTLREKNFSLSNDLSALTSKLSDLQDEITKQKRKRTAAKKETKELRDENRRLNGLVANLQSQAPPETASEDASSLTSSAGGGKAKRPVPPLGTANVHADSVGTRSLTSSGRPTPPAGASPTSPHSTSTSSPASKRWALTDDSLAQISASLSHHQHSSSSGGGSTSPLGQSMPSLSMSAASNANAGQFYGAAPGSAPKSFILGHRPAPPSGPPPPSTGTSLTSSGGSSGSANSSSTIIMGSPPINYLNPTNSNMPAILSGAGAGAGAGSSWASAGVSLHSSTSSYTPPGRADSPLLTHSTSNGSLRMGIAKSSSGSTINSSAHSGNIFGTPHDVVHGADNSIRAASLDTLIRLLPSSDSNYIDTFLMTYRAFCTADELFVRMVHLWEAASSGGSNEALKVFRIKFMNVIIKWIEKHGVDFDDSSLHKMSKFLDIQASEGAISSTTRDKIAKLIKHKLERTSKKVLHTGEAHAPQPILPAQDLEELDVTVLDPLEVARQITLLDEQAYKSIAASECMNQSWNKPAICNEVSPNIIKMISRFNATSNWAARLIVTEANVRKRKSIITRLIKLAQRLRELHNYHSLMALIAALESAPVTRMKKTWDAIDSAYVKQFQELRAIMSAEGSYKAFRAVIKTEDPPVIPYIGVYLADLTFIEDGNPSTIQHETLGELINFAKMKLLDGIIQDINMYQQAPYKLEPVPKIQLLLTAAEEIRFNDKEMFEHSLKSEPRTAPK